jgi:hypothetical protein
MVCKDPAILRFPVEALTSFERQSYRSWQFQYNDQPMTLLRNWFVCPEDSSLNAKQL